MSSSSRFNNNNGSSNNNNYITSFYGDISPGSPHQLVENAAHIRSFGAPHNFTFTYPTQGATVTSPRASIQAYSSMGFGSAPGLGTAWQHSNPVPFSRFGSGATTTPVYTGMPARSDPQPSCSSPVKRPKRKAGDHTDDAPFSKVYLCTDQFANLNINPVPTRSSSYEHTSMCGMSEVVGDDPRGWRRFQKVENSIESDSKDENNSQQQTGVLHISEAIKDTLSSPSESILPPNVLKEIGRPCMQIVLWRSPGELVRDIVKEETDSLESPTPSSPPSHKLSSPFSSSSSGSPSSSRTSMSVNRLSSKYAPMSSTSSSSTRSTELWLSNKDSRLASPTSVQNLSKAGWNWSSQSPSNIDTCASKDSAAWDDNLDLDFTVDCDEEMQL